VTGVQTCALPIYVAARLFGNVVEETTETITEYTGAVVSGKPLSKAFDENGGLYGLGIAYGLGVLFDMDMPWKRFTGTIDPDDIIRHTDTPRGSIDINGNQVDDTMHQADTIGKNADEPEIPKESIYDPEVATRLSKQIDDKYTANMEDANSYVGPDGKKIFEFYDTHTQAHIKLVQENSIFELTKIQESLRLRGPNSGFIDPIGLADRLSVENVGLGAKCHDLGMAKDGVYKHSEIVDGEIVSEMRRITDKTGVTMTKVIEKKAKSTSVEDALSDIDNTDVSTKKSLETKQLSYEDAIRESHTLNSALETLRILENVDCDKESIALEIFLHSKSNSGVSLLDLVGDENKAAWISAINDLEAAAKLADVKFDKSKFYIGGDLNVFKLEQVAMEALALRIGDSHAIKIRQSQAGHDLIASRDITYLPKSYDDEIIHNTAYIIRDGVSDVVTNPLSYKIIIGEQNVESMITSVNPDGTLVRTFTIFDEGAPYSTLEHGILERFGEYKSASGNIGDYQIVQINLPKGTPPEVKQLYEDILEGKITPYEKYMNGIRAEFICLDIDVNILP
jgi:hypothetical protein